MPELESLVCPSSGYPGFGVLCRVSGSENLTFVSSSSEGSTSPSSFESLVSDDSLASSLLLSSLVKDDFNFLTTHFLISSLDTREFAFLGTLFSGEADPVLLFGLMKLLRSSFLPSFSLEYLRSVGPDFRRRVSFGSLYLSSAPGRPLFSSVFLRSSDHASDLRLYESISASRSNSLARHS